MKKNLLRLLLIAPLLIAVTARALVPAENFFTQPDMINAAISPDGKKVVTLRLRDNQPQLNLLDTTSLKERPLFSAADYRNEGGTSGDNASEDSAISELVWLDNRYLAVQFSEMKKGIKDLMDTKLSRRLLILDTSKPTPEVLSVRTRGWLAHPLPETSGEFLYAKSGSASKLYRLQVSGLAADKARLGKLDRVDGGQFTAANEVKSVKGYALRWFISASGEPLAVLAFTRDPALKLFSLADGDQEKTLKIWGEDDIGSEDSNGGVFGPADKPSLLPIMPAAEKDSFYCLDMNEPTERSVYLVNYVSGEEKRIYQTASYQVLDILVDRDQQFVGVRVLKDGTLLNEYSAEAAPVVSSDVDGLLAPLDASSNGDVMLLYSEAHNRPGRILLQKNGQPEKVIGKLYPQLKAQLSARRVSKQMTIDGLEIPYQINLPTGSGRFPLVVMPHGGPIGVYDTPYFDEVTQFLVAQGYAVLRVDYRGSSGHTDELMEAGKQQWGSGIVRDIHEIAKTVVREPYVDASAVCLMGLSYGGYATAELLTRYPETYRCGVAFSGPYDLNLYINFRQRSDGQRQWIHDYIGNPAKQYDELKAISPLYRAAELQRPIMIIHGRQDEVVSVEQAYRYSLLLEKFGKPHELYIDDEVGHDFSKPERVAKMMDKAAVFLHDHIR